MTELTKEQKKKELERVMAGCNRTDPDPKYFEKYEFQKDEKGNYLDGSRFNKEKSLIKKEDVTKEDEDLDGRPKTRFPPSGKHTTDLDALMNQYKEDALKRPWIPMAKMPARLPTMGEMPYPPVETPRIGTFEDRMNIYLLVACGYNSLMEKFEELSKEFQEYRKLHP